MFILLFSIFLDQFDYCLMLLFKNSSQVKDLFEDSVPLLDDHLASMPVIVTWVNARKPSRFLGVCEVPRSPNRELR